MQAVTRNPLAEPGLLGINAGAALAIIIGAAAFNLVTPLAYVGFAFIGATNASSPAAGPAITPRATMPAPRNNSTITPSMHCATSLAGVSDTL